MRHSAGFMLGADALSLFGPDTDHAYGHLGFTNVLAWADPERRSSVGLITSGKPIAAPGPAAAVGAHPPDRPRGAEGQAPAAHQGDVACRTASLSASVRRWVIAWYSGSRTMSENACRLG